MAETTGIAWCDSTRNFWVGCTKVSPGCDHCYAEAADRRFHAGVHWGIGAERQNCIEGAAKDLRRWNAKASKTGVPQRVFINSQSDFFDNEVPAIWRDMAWSIMSECSALTFLLLTKRIGNVASMLPADFSAANWPHIWIGASVVGQAEAMRDLPKLREVDAAVRFVSYEPAIAPVEWATETHGFEWLIVGGESHQGGNNARPFEIKWAEQAIAAAYLARVAVFVKQLGSNPIDAAGQRVRLIFREGVDRAGSHIESWPKNLRVRQFPK